MSGVKSGLLTQFVDSICLLKERHHWTTDLRPRAKSQNLHVMRAFRGSLLLGVVVDGRCVDQLLRVQFIKIHRTLRVSRSDGRRRDDAVV